LKNPLVWAHGPRSGGGAPWRPLCLGLVALATAAATMPAAAVNEPPDTGADAAVSRGGVVFASNCVTCHGVNADGGGRIAHLYLPRPANLRQSDKNDAYLALIIRKGGAAMGRSEFMPAWESELSEGQVRDLVSYLRSINNRPPK
jgi:mono/diheme cytochrome c family protein